MRFVSAGNLRKYPPSACHSSVGMMRPIPVLDDEETTGAQPWEEQRKARPRGNVVVGGVVDDEVERLVADVFVDDAREVVGVALVDVVQRTDRVTEPVLGDEAIQRRRALGGDVDRDE